MRTLLLVLLMGYATVSLADHNDNNRQHRHHDNWGISPNIVFSFGSGSDDNYSEDDRARGYIYYGEDDDDDYYRHHRRHHHHDRD